MPAAAVIPAPTAYINVVAVKKLVVEVMVCAMILRLLSFGIVASYFLPCRIFAVFGVSGFTVASNWTAYYCEKIRVFQADVYLNSSAWNNRIGEITLLLVLGWFLMMNRDSWGH